MASKLTDKGTLGSPRGRRGSPSPSPQTKARTNAGSQIVGLQERNGTIRQMFWINDAVTPAASKPLFSQRWSPKQLLYEIFLPEGFPGSVSEDYVAYQIYDSIQALASSFTGTLSTKAILQGVGVGNSAATATAATLQWVIKDGSGMLGRIIFSWVQGSNLDANAKTWRFMADIINDVAMTLEICIPLAPHLFLPIVCTTSILKSIVGAAGGATRAALTQHQARRNNMADVSSKDGSQETALVLVGMLLSLVIMPLIGDSQTLTWIFFVFFTIVHLISNYLAVSSVAMDKLNRQRANIVIAHYLRSGFSEVLSPSQVRRLESILYFETDTSIELGCSIETALKRSPPTTTLEQLARQFWENDRRYVLIHSGTRISILFLEEATQKDILQSYLEANLIQRGYSSKRPFINGNHFESLLARSGWNVEANLLGASQIRVKLKSSSNPQH